MGASPLTSHKRLYGLAGTLVVIALVAACGGTARRTTQDEPTTTSANLAWQLVALGDSDATGNGDPTGGGWVQRYADIVHERTGRAVNVVQRAEDGLTSDQMLSTLKSDAGMRTEIARADIVVIGAGGADLNAGDDAWAAGTCSAEACYKDGLASFGRNIAAVAALVAELRGGDPTLLRAVTLPNGLTGAEDVIPMFLKPVATRLGVYQARTLRRSICSAVRSHGGNCIDVLTAFNGTKGTTDAYRLGWMNHAECCYPSGKGQQLMAELLVKTGLDPRPLQ